MTANVKPNRRAVLAMPWQEIDSVLLDMDGTLLDLHFDNFFWLEHLPRRYARIHERDEDAARLELAERFRAEQGSLNWYCVDHWSRELGLDVSALKREVRHLIAVRPYVEEFLVRLHASRQRVLLVTNAHHKSLELKLAHVGLERWFDAIVSSHDFRRAKEEPGFWAALAAVEPFDPARTLLVDDSLPVLDSARLFGIAQLVTIRKPDTTRPEKDTGDYPAIDDFSQLMPM